MPVHEEAFSFSLVRGEVDEIGDMQFDRLGQLLRQYNTDNATYYQLTKLTLVPRPDRDARFLLHLRGRRLVVQVGLNDLKNNMISVLFF